MISTTTTLKQSLILCLFLSCFCTNFRPTNAFVPQTIERPQNRHRCQRSIVDVSSRSILYARGDSEDGTNQKEDEGDEEDDNPVEEFLAMQEASQRVNRRLMMPRMIMSSIGGSIQFMAYAFLISSFALNLAGYAIINDGNSIHIGTLEERDFQMAIIKSMKDK